MKVPWILKYVLLVLFISTFPFSGCNKEAGKQDANKERLNKQLWDAVIDRDIIKVRSALESGADVDARAYGGWTPLMRAVSDGNYEISKLLIDRGADVNAKENFGNPLLFFSLRKNKINILNLLLEKGVYVNVKNWEGNPALSVAASYGIEVAKPLIEKGADVNARDNDGKTPLMTAAVYGRADVVKLFIEKGADVNAKTKSGATAISLMTPYIGHEMDEVRAELRKAGGKRVTPPEVINPNNADIGLILKIQRHPVESQ
jgi:ankyrin repeat protein